MDTEKGTQETAKSFAQFPLKSDLLAGLQICEHLKPFEVQERALTAILEGRDVFVESSEGSGKTVLAFISALQLIDPAAKECQALILYPTRERTFAGKETAMKVGQKMNFKMAEILGGTPRQDQNRILKDGVSLVIGTPGRILDLSEQGNLRLKALKLVIIEGCSDLINLGFGEIMKGLFKFVPPNVQMCILSSDCSVYVKKFNDFCLRKPVEIRMEQLSGDMSDFEHYKFMVEKEEKKAKFLVKLHEEIGMAVKSIVYCKKTEDVEELVRSFRDKNFSAIGITDKNRSILKFAESSEQIIVTTDPQFLTGLDCRNIGVLLIINHDVPESREDYRRNLGKEFLSSNKRMVINLTTPSEAEILKIIEVRFIRLEEIPFDDFVQYFKEEKSQFSQDLKEKN